MPNPFISVIHRYLELKSGSGATSTAVPRVVVFGGKAAPGYYIAKLVIRLICAVAEVVNNDPHIQHRLSVVFIPDYNVSVAEVIVPASDTSQHISTAGTEASGTSNMKFVLNGGLIVGTLDGANIEIREEIARVAHRSDCMFVFGATADQVDDIRHQHRYPHISFKCLTHTHKCRYGSGAKMPGELQAVLAAIQAGRFGDPAGFQPLLDTLRTDYYLLTHDFVPYLQAQATADQLYSIPQEWARRSILSAASMGHFSSDRCIREYATEIWGLKPCPVPVSGEMDGSAQ